MENDREAKRLAAQITRRIHQHIKSVIVGWPLCRDARRGLHIELEKAAADAWLAELNRLAQAVPNDWRAARPQ